MTVHQSVDEFFDEHWRITRRHLLRMGAVALGASTVDPRLVTAAEAPDEVRRQALEQLPAWLTPQGEFQDVSRGKPKPHTLSDEQRAEVGLTRETWKLQLISDAENPARLGNPMSVESGNPLDWAQLMRLTEANRIRFAKVMTCLNVGCPLGMGIWEGVPLRDAIWLTQPKEDLRRVFYYGYHNDDPQQMFRSSLPVGRVLEDPPGLPPVILCTKLNGQWLTPERGGPVRVVVPEAYGFKSIKWLTHVVLSNLAHANDTYAEKNNDVDSSLKTFCATLTCPARVKPKQPFAVTGWAQAGVSGLKRVQVWLHDNAEPLPEDDPQLEFPRFVGAPWQDAEPLAASHELPDGLSDSTYGFNPQTGQPRRWPLKLCRAHWIYVHPGLPAGRYTLRCRTIDEQGAAQPMPRPFRKSGHAAIEARPVVVEA